MLNSRLGAELIKRNADEASCRLLVHGDHNTCAIMSRSMLPTQLLVVIAGLLLTDTVTIEDLDKQHLSETDQTESYMPFLCPTPPPLPSFTASSVDTVRPADLSALYWLSTSLSGRDVTSKIVSRLAELLSMFNPALVTGNVKLQSQTWSLQQEAQELSRAMSDQVSGWKLVLLLVSTHHTCDSSTYVDAVVREAEAALQILQEQLRQTLLHVVVFIPNQPNNNTCTRPENTKLSKAILLQKLLDSLQSVLARVKWHPSATAMLQPLPLILEDTPDQKDITSKLALQLWTNMLQPSSAPSEDITIACPTQDRPFLRTQVNSPKSSSRAIWQKAQGMGTEIPCKDRRPSPKIPNSVHELRPADIKVVAAVGDSLTAGNGVGAKYDNLLLVINEYRGLSWSIGGDENIETVTTLPNILREFNPSLTGFSQGVGKQDSPAAFLNQAVAGAKSGDVVEQVRTLVDMMKNDTRIDFQNDWKVITMFIGGNDICDFCTDTVIFSPRNVVKRIRQALDILHREVPRALVNLVELLYIIPLRQLHKDNALGCPTWFVRMVCPCVLKPKDGSLELQKTEEFNRAYQHAMQQLVDSGHYDSHDNFTVVLQPFFREVFLPTLPNGKPDRSYFTPDCFHLSQKAHTLMARALWNNMLEPVGNKTSTQDFMSGIDLKCPSETAPFLRTAVNSNYTFPGPPPPPTTAPNWGRDFSCPNTEPSDSPPTSAHRVRPADIKVVAALGDSVTAGFGAKAQNLFQLRTEYRGVSWSIGGDKNLETVTTLANILRKFNPELKGMSKGQGKKRTGFNMSATGAKVAGIPEQIRRLIDTMKNDTTVDFAHDWKLVTLFIGGNDLCQFCNDRASLSPKNYSHHLVTSLDILYNEVPRTIVNILEILQIEDLRRIKRDSIGCNVIQPLACPCFLLPGDDSPELAEAKRMNRELQIETEKVAYGGRYDDREDFAVVVQPFFRNSIVPLNADGRPDVSYFTEDCFHFSERGHADMAVAMWNNMLEPVGRKQTFNNFTSGRGGIKCPTEENPYIFTRMNSGLSLPSTHCPMDIPIWLAVVLAVSALLLGWGLTWLVLTWRNKRTMSTAVLTVEMKAAVL
ncbi:phospholipase B1, membrane-associated isoform X2 [Corythoichthys intestinalis]|uniref:phospholipase B1, membrane-associated isoform X2 n=1 Tax=Corythoichthys intestinalis TaxID=161448 RepID=UPI0025A4E66F|nr:phospholipase B1, membrane-associated-like isoform X2 [Corythoichthys intestinalis]